MIRKSISHFNAEDDELLSRRSILNKDQMDWLKQVESASDKVISPLQDLEDSLHPVVNYMIIPVFAFANAASACGTWNRRQYGAASDSPSYADSY